MKCLDTKLSSFAGSPVNGEASRIYYEISYGHPEMSSISIKSEVFALDPIFYEIITSFKPYNGFSDSKSCGAYYQGNHPCLVSLAAFDNIITKCWIRGYKDVD
jgi:hypothetical protein